MTRKMKRELRSKSILGRGESELYRMLLRNQSHDREVLTYHMEDLKEVLQMDAEDEDALSEPKIMVKALKREDIWD